VKKRRARASVFDALARLGFTGLTRVREFGKQHVGLAICRRNGVAKGQTSKTVLAAFPSSTDCTRRIGLGNSKLIVGGLIL